MDILFETMPKIQKQVLDAQKLPPDQKEKVRQQVQATMDGMRKGLNWESIKPIFVKIYADNFDEAELEGIIAYYKTPVGQKWIEKQPTIQTAKTQAITDIILKIQAAALDSAKHVDDKTGVSPMPNP